MSAALPHVVADRSMRPIAHDAPLFPASIELVVRDLDRVGAFYRSVIGLSVIADDGARLALGAGGTPLLTLLEDRQAEPSPTGAPGLFHTAFVLPTRADLGQWLARAARNGWALEGMSDHLVSEAIYLSDPEGNGIEIYRDRPRAEWQMDGHRVRMANRRIDAEGLLQLADAKSIGTRHQAPDGTRIGHVHLCVSDLDAAVQTIGSDWGFAETCRYPGAIFFATGGYHHHVAANVWNTRSGARRERGQLGLQRLTFAAGDDGAAADITRRWRGSETTWDGIAFVVASPS
jgi:catechol 2,3-dioxygenase